MHRRARSALGAPANVASRSKADKLACFEAVLLPFCAVSCSPALEGLSLCT